MILIGNGFDLAHNLETSYQQFINWLCKKNNTAYNEHIKSSKDKFVVEGMITYTPPIDSVARAIPKQLINIKPVDGMILSEDETHWIVQTKYDNLFLKEIIRNYIKKSWVDIEEEYYKLLKNTINNHSSDYSIENLNKDFKKIQQILEEYLLSEKCGRNVTIIEGLQEAILDDSNNLNKILFLNFNYIDTHKIYIESILNCTLKFKREDLPSIHIHGELGQSSNPIIFGYGDENDSDYSKVKELGGKYLDNIKQIRYLDTDNYKLLDSFIESDDYQIFIMGHSCGKSDGTLLKMLFEHENCQSIKIFYHKKDGTDDFTDKYKNITRIFSKENVLRKKVIQKPCSIPLPQLIKGKR